MKDNFKLQPLVVFRDETTGLNELYWTAHYSFRRVNTILSALASLGHAASDPRVDNLWPSVNAGERRHITLRSSEFAARCDRVLGRLRTASILHLCSAFENCVANNLVLCFLYSPSADSALTQYDPVPKVMRDRSQYSALIQAAIARSAALMRGRYSSRLQCITSLFGLAISLGPRAAELDRYYSIRHAIAHDQALAQTDAPDASAHEILASRIVINEATWKDMLNTFFRVAETLDGEIRQRVVRDGGLHLAVYRYVIAEPGITLGTLTRRVQAEWGLPAYSVDVRRVAPEIGLIIKAGPTVSRQTVHLS